MSRVHAQKNPRSKVPSVLARKSRLSSLKSPVRGTIDGVMAQDRFYARADFDLMLGSVVTDYEAAETTQTVLEIAFPIVVVLDLASGE